jgi:formylglycine-generating enzyme required for sulfatase activity
MKTRWLIMAGLIALCGMAQADSITHGGTTVSMDFVNIGTPGNAADTTGYGAVANSYRIGKYEVKASDWAAVIAADSRVGNAGSWSGSQPTGSSSWFEAAKFCNWLTSGDAYLGAYQFDGSGALTNVMTRAQMIANGGLFYALPTENEWYKAAYFNGGVYSLYANGTDTAPVAGTDANYWPSDGGGTWAVGSGAAEQNGTYDMMGNVWEWNESAWDGVLNDMTEWRVQRGGSYGDTEYSLRSSVRSSFDPAYEISWNGFRVVAIPEPASAMLVLFGAGVGVVIHRLRRSAMRR